MNRVLLCTFTTLLLCLTMHAQHDVIPSAGNYESNSTFSLSWTLGETITETCSSSGVIINQGFQQTFIDVSSLRETLGLQFKITVYPNPTSGKVTIMTDSPKGLVYRLFDTNGKMLRTAELKANTDIDFSRLSLSVYFIKILQGNNEIKTFKIVKR